jgi:hypothetical protein
VLGWDVRYSAVGGEERLADVNAFFGSSRGDPDAAFEILPPIPCDSRDC